MNLIVMTIVMVFVLLIVLAFSIIFLIKKLGTSLVIIVQKQGGLLLRRIKPQDGKFSIGNHDYPVDSKAAHPDRGLIFWRSIFVFDEGVAAPRYIAYKSDKRLDTGSMQKLMNKEFISGVVTSMMGIIDTKKIMMLLTIIIIVSIVNMVGVIVMIGKVLGLFGAV